MGLLDVLLVLPVLVSKSSSLTAFETRPDAARRADVDFDKDRTARLEAEKADDRIDIREAAKRNMLNEIFMLAN